MSNRDAFKNNDVNLSIQNHNHPEKHLVSISSINKPIIFGALDGIITTFALITSAIGSDIPINKIFIISLAKIIADAFSMAFGEYISNESNRSFYNSERKRELWECQNYLNGEKKEMINLYIEKGLDKNDAITVVNIFSKNINFFVDIMMIEELELIPIDSIYVSIKNGIVMFISFIIFGFIPLVPYIFDTFFVQYYISCLLTAILLFIIGVYNAFISDNKWYIGGFSMILQCSISATIAYFVSIL